MNPKYDILHLEYQKLCSSQEAISIIPHSL